ncbi:flagellar biosynthesis protein FlhF [Dechloromonas sp. ZY10]|uniref:flagellar biosynthesis protein FlhF n=1 Tax=Dechloromonas aquae TaxID=2664436 RepID=UPI0035296833
MNVKKFVAANAREALKRVKETLGNDAIILSNRGVAGGVEIMAVAARDMAMMVPGNSEPQTRHTAPLPATDETDDYRLLLSAARARAARPVEFPTAAPSEVHGKRNGQARHDPALFVNAGIPKTGGLRNLETSRPAPHASAAPNPAKSRLPAEETPLRHTIDSTTKGTTTANAADVVPQEVMDEIRSLRKIVEQHLTGFAWGETAKREPVKTEVLRKMLDSGFSPQFSRELLSDLPVEMDEQQALAWVKGAADRALQTINTDSDIVDRGGVYALVGPTGVGKTTTTAKLAARCVLKHGPNKVALITTDSYRIGAHEQLRIYGRILGVSVHLVKDATELRQTLNELQHKHMVLVDTMGMSQKDRLVPELTDMLAGCDVQRLLLLSSTSRGDTLDEVVNAYLGDHLAGCILTKIDEAASLASPLDVIMRHGLRLHYVSNGQRVPEDLHLPNRSYLLHRAFRDLPDTSPFKHDGLEPGLMLANGVAAAGGRRG